VEKRREEKRREEKRREEKRREEKRREEKRREGWKGREITKHSCSHYICNVQKTTLN
jgi:hypothetical protein